MPSSETGTLYVVSMPIGNPEDITLRALRVLSRVSAILAENASLTRDLLTGYPLAPMILSMRPREGAPALAAALTHLREGRDVALVADAGTPTLVDPGLRVVRAALDAGCRVTAVPGATACLSALVISGFSPTPFRFLGFAPRLRAERSEFFGCLSAGDETLILYESPRYLRVTLQALCRCVGKSRKIVVACDLTHTAERIFRGTISEAVVEFAADVPSGAYTLVVSGAVAFDSV